MHWTFPLMLFQTKIAFDSPRTSSHSVFASVELPSAINGRPSAVAVVSQSTVVVVVVGLSAIEYRTSEWLPAIVMPRLVFKPPSHATRIGQAGRGVSPFPSEKGIYLQIRHS